MKPSIRYPGKTIRNENADGSSTFLYIVIIALVIITLFVMLPHITSSLGRIVDKIPLKMP